MSTITLKGPNEGDIAVVDPDSEALHALTGEGWTVVEEEEPTEEAPAEDAPAEDAKPKKSK